MYIRVKIALFNIRKVYFKRVVFTQKDWHFNCLGLQWSLLISIVSNPKNKLFERYSLLFWSGYFSPSFGANFREGVVWTVKLLRFILNSEIFTLYLEQWNFYSLFWTVKFLLFILNSEIFTLYLESIL